MTQFKCLTCGQISTTDEQLEDGARVECPFCHTKTEYRKPAEAVESPKRRPLARSSAGANPPHPSSSPPSAPSRSHATVDYTRLALRIVAVSAVVLGVTFFFYQMKTTRTAARAREAALEAQKLEKEEAQRKEAAERERLEKQREEAERVAREKKEEEARRARELKREQQAEKAAAERLAAQKIRDLYQNAPKMFERKTCRFATGTPKEQVLDPRLPCDKECRFWAVDASYPERKEFYILTTGTKGLESVKCLAPNAKDMTEVNVMDFKKRLDDARWAVTREDDAKNEVWMFGTPDSSRFVDYPDASRPFIPINDELGDLAPVVQALELRFDKVKYRVVLKAKKGSEEIPVDTIDCDAQIPLDALQACVGKVLLERKAKRFRKQIKPLKLQKIPKRTVVFYDGNKISRSIGGVTKIPRSFESSVYAQRQEREMERERERRVSRVIPTQSQDSNAYMRWKQLAAQARAQEKLENEIRQANYEAQEEYKRKLSELKDDVRVMPHEMTEALNGYRLYVEREK